MHSAAVLLCSGQDAFTLHKHAVKSSSSMTPLNKAFILMHTLDMTGQKEFCVFTSESSIEFDLYSDYAKHIHFKLCINK